MGQQGRTQGRQLLVGLQPPEPLGGFQHGGAGPAEHHRGIPPTFDVAADLPNSAVHVLDDVGAGQRPAQLERQPEAGDGKNFIQPLQNAGGDAGRVTLQATGEVSDQSLGLVGVIQFPRLPQSLADAGMKGLGKAIRDVAGLVGVMPRSA